MLRIIISAILTLSIAFASTAQSRIDKIADELEKKADVETTYTERRTAKKKKLYRISRILNFNNKDYYSKLVKAFEDERENTVSAVKTRESLTYRFDNDKGESSYTLSNAGNGRNPYSLVISWRARDADKLESMNGSDFGPDFMTIEVPSREEQEEIVKKWAESSKCQREAYHKRAQLSKERAKLAKERAKLAKERARLAKERGRFATDSEKNRRIRANAASATCTIVSPAGSVSSFPAIEALDNDDILDALAALDPETGGTVVLTSISGQTTTVTVSPQSEAQNNTYIIEI